MTIYYENGEFSLHSVDSLDQIPRTSARKIARLIGKNQNNPENEDCIVTFCDWICERIELAQAIFLNSNRLDKKAESKLKFYISLSHAAGF